MHEYSSQFSDLCGSIEVMAVTAMLLLVSLIRWAKLAIDEVRQLLAHQTDKTREKDQRGGQSKRRQPIPQVPARRKGDDARGGPKVERTEQ